MFWKKTFIALFLIAYCSIAQNITISGIVTDTGTTPLPGALVKLEKNGLTATTGTDGAFTLTNVGIIVNGGVYKGINISASIHNGFIHLHIREKGIVEIITYTLKGETVFSQKMTLDVGRYKLAIPNQCNGFYLYRIKHGTSTLLLKSTFIDRVKGACCSVLNTMNSNPVKAANLSSRYVPLDDVIMVKKDGYLNYRVIVTNSDTSGIEIKMIVCADTVRDIDGNLYQAVRIGNQVWTVENLRVTRYNDGNPIFHEPDQSEWGSLLIPQYCYYENTTDRDSIKKYGALYNGYVAVDTVKSVAPAGWHIPSHEEWDTLVNYLVANGYNWDGTAEVNKIAKSLAAMTDWELSPFLGTPGYDLKTNNRTGFSALPAGYRDPFNFVMRSGMIIFWTSTDRDSRAWFRRIFTKDDRLILGNYSKSFGLSIRLVRNYAAVN